MDLTQLTYFRTVASLEHMTKAAEVLYVSQPSLSRTISNLEKELGTELFYRTGRKITLNRYGRIFLKHVDRALEELELGKDAVAQALAGAERPIVVSCVLTGLITDLSETYMQYDADPQVSFRMDPYDSFPALMQEGKVDFFISEIPLLTVPTQDWVRVTRESVYVLMSKNHPLAGEETLRLEQLRQERFTLPEKSAPIRSVLDHFLKTRGINLQVRYEINDVYAQLYLIERGSVISLVPRSALYDMVCKRTSAGYQAIENLVAIPLADENMEWEIGVSPLCGQERAPRAAEFRNHCIELFRTRDKEIQQGLNQFCKRQNR